MRRERTRVFAAVSTWVIAAAFALALVSIGVVTTLQERANTSRDAQVTLGQIERDFDALQSIPFDGNGQGAAAFLTVLPDPAEGEAAVPPAFLAA